MNLNEFSILREIVISPYHEPSINDCTHQNPCKDICKDTKRRISIAVVWDGLNKKGIKLKEYNQVTNASGTWRNTDWGIDFGNSPSDEESFQQALLYIHNWKIAVNELRNDYPELIPNPHTEINNHIRNPDIQNSKFSKEINDYVNINIKKLSKQSIIYEDPKPFHTYSRQISLAVVCNDFHIDWLRKNKSVLTSHDINSYCNGQHKNPKLMKFQKYYQNSEWFESPYGMTLNGIIAEEYASHFTQAVKLLTTITNHFNGIKPIPEGKK